MLTKQILKYIDENQSIRFLIAECDYPLTVMTALYFSKLFGVESKIDISPLFETEKGLEIGDDVIRTLLKNLSIYFEMIFSIGIKNILSSILYSKNLGRLTGI